MRKSNATKYLHQDADNLLDKQIESCFEGTKGPGSLPLKNYSEPIRGAIIPSDNYDLAGPAMAWAYYTVSGIKTPDVYIIISKNHNSEETTTSTLTTETPYGLVRIDQPFVRALVEKGNIQISDEDFSSQKSIDSQLPFLQYGKKSEIEKIKIVPILIGDKVNISELSADIKEVLSDQGKEAFFICASNMTRYGSKFKYVPFTEKVKETIYEMDGKALNFLKEMNYEGFQDYLKKNFMNISGKEAIGLMFKLITPNKVRLEQYYASFDIIDEKNPSIAYASLLIE